MKKINFGQDWSFKLNGAEAIRVNVPHDFSIAQPRRKDAPSAAAGGYFQGGMGEYEKTFKSTQGKRYFFMCDGAFGITDVYVNANIVYTSKYPYASFCIDITDYLRYDKENLIYIRVNQTHLPNARWYTGAGLFRDVFLCECDEAYIAPYGACVITKAIDGTSAHLVAEAEIFTPRSTEGTVGVRIFDAEGTLIKEMKKRRAFEKGMSVFSTAFTLESVKLWDVEAPNMYKAEISLDFDGSYDTDTVAFGVRTLALDKERGLLLNGKSVKLRGGCVHHDQGALGSATFAEAEYRRVAKLKEAGFNSLRCSHNPQSQHFYDACDRLGVLVMDELFDYWSEGKQANDFHPFFLDNYEKWIESIVKRNRCHPSIFAWSTGNEIPQKTGRGNGYEIARNIASKVRSIDTSRFVTHALCSLWDNKEEFDLENATKHFGADKMDHFATATKPTADTVDIVGYNYLEYRLERDLERFPERIFANTETFPICAYTTIKQQMANPRILGDYVWTAWDYFGETGIGHVDYHEQGEGFRLLDYPYHIANCGDIDICGVRKPQSYYREIAWEIRKAPYITARHPKDTEILHFPSAWGFYECERSWAYPEYEGKDIEIYVFAECDRLVLELNGEKIGEMARTENGVYIFKAKYKSGTLVARAFVDGVEIARDELSSEGKASKISLRAEKSYLANGADVPNERIIYADVEIQDENGNLCTQESRFVAYEAQGAEIVGLASGELVTEQSYQASEGNTYRGRAFVILKAYGNGKITLTARADGFESATLEI